MAKTKTKAQGFLSDKKNTMNYNLKLKAPYESGVYKLTLDADYSILQYYDYNIPDAPIRNMMYINNFDAIGNKLKIMNEMNTFILGKKEAWESKIICVGECIRLTAHSPVDIYVVDPDGLTISKQINEIPKAVYIEADLNGDGDLDDTILIPDRKLGNYSITVIPEPDAEPTDTFTLEVSIGGENITFAENVPVSDIPDQPYKIISAEGGLALPPSANADGPYTGTEGQPVIFDGSASYDPEGEPLTYNWDFGDGTTGEGINPTHIYAQEGTYTVTLTVNDGARDSTPSTTTATIEDTEPTADFTPDTTSGLSPLTIQFTDTSTSYDGIIVWEWDFNGDGIIDSNEQNPVYTYTEAGTYTVSLTVNEADGDSDTETKENYITVESAEDTEPPVIESVTLDSYINIPDSTFHVTVEVTDNRAVESVTADGISLTETGSWEGDVYIPPDIPEGTYTLTVTAEDEAGNTAQAEVEYTVVIPQGGFAVAVDPMMSSAAVGDVKVYKIKIVSNENFDDKLHVYLNDEGIPDLYKADFAFNWNEKTVYLKSGDTIELSLEVTIPQATGYKMFRIYADSMKFRTSGYCTEIVLIS